MNTFNFSIIDGFILPQEAKSFINLISVGFIHDLNLLMRVEKYHSHKFFEAHFVFEGDIDYIIEGRKATICAKQFIIFPPGRKHEVIRCSPGVLKLSVSFEIDNLMYYQAFEAADGIYEFDSNVNKNIKFIIEQIETKNAFRIVIINRILEIVYLTATQVMNIYTDNLKSDATDCRFLKAKEYILSDRRRFFTCNEVANYCEISEKQLNRLFKRYEGMTSSDFIYQQKISDIKKIIRITTLPFNEIAKRMGFASASYFVKFFKKHTGMTPNEYRKKCGDDRGFDVIEL